MKKIFSINGAIPFGHSKGELNQLFFEADQQFFTTDKGFELKSTHIEKPYDADEEAEKFMWADAVIYHFPAWWMGMPYALKEYFDKVLTTGKHKGMYQSDGRSLENLDINYGTGGLMNGRKYMVATTWNAPEAAFTLPGEFFQQKSVDDGVLFGFHRMHAFIGMEPIESIHFHDVNKRNSPQRIEALKEQYLKHINTQFLAEAVVK